MGMSDSHYSMEVRGAGDSVVIRVFVSLLQVQGLTEKRLLAIQTRCGPRPRLSTVCAQYGVSKLTA